MAEDTNQNVDAYYGDNEAGADEVDLSFLDEEKDA